MRYPKSVRTVVLDGASLPDVRVYDASPRNAEQALDAELGRCARAPACRRDYPHTRQQLTELLARPARRVTLESGTVLLRPDDVAWTVNALSESADGAATIPYAIDAAVRGDYTPLAHAYADRLGPDLDARARLAAFWVILCSEPWAGFDPAATARAAPGSYLGAAAVDRARLFARACRVVPTGRVPAGAGTVETSATPVLLLAGGADPVDPVANLRGWRTAFPNGRLVVVAGAGHGAIGYDCVQRLVADFVAAGSADGLDASLRPPRAAPGVRDGLAEELRTRQAAARRPAVSRGRRTSRSRSTCRSRGRCSRCLRAPSARRSGCTRSRPRRS